MLLNQTWVRSPAHSKASLLTQGCDGSESCSVVSPWTVAPGCSVYGIPQARILEWVAIPFSRESSQPRDRTQVSCIAGGFFIIWATREAQESVHCRHQARRTRQLKLKAQLPLAFREAFLKPRWGRGVAGCVISSPYAGLWLADGEFTGWCHAVSSQVTEGLGAQWPRSSDS